MLLTVLAHFNVLLFHSSYIEVIYLGSFPLSNSTTYTCCFKAKFLPWSCESKFIKYLLLQCILFVSQIRFAILFVRIEGLKKGHQKEVEKLSRKIEKIEEEWVCIITFCTENKENLDLLFQFLPLFQMYNCFHILKLILPDVCI